MWNTEKILAYETKGMGSCLSVWKRGNSWYQRESGNFPELKLLSVCSAVWPLLVHSLIVTSAFVCGTYYESHVSHRKCVYVVVVFF